MKIVFLLGNGFDSAHSSPTSFIDFSEWLFFEKIIPDLEKYIKEKKESKYFNSTILNKIEDFVFPTDKFSENINLLGVFQSYKKEQQNIILNRNSDFIFNHLSNSLLKSLYKEKSEFWFNIEETFFRKLKEESKKIQLSNQYSSNNLESLKALNNYFDQIKLLLQEYLLSLKIEKNKHIESFFKNFNKENLNESNKLHIINFNYTNTISLYYKPSEPEVYYPIHGDLHNEIIFGYGNDKDKDYKEIKELGEDMLLEHFKTHKYLLNSVYQDLYNNLIKTKEKFEIHIIGHSLGQTDKTLLQEILNSENCKKIHLYKRADKHISGKKENEQIEVKKEFTKLTMASTRIIEDERARIKITHYEDSKYFPTVGQLIH